MLLFVGLVRAQRDGNGPGSTVQNDIAGGRSIRGFSPSVSKTSLDLVQGSCLFLLRLVRRSDVFRVAGIGRRAIVEANFSLVNARPATRFSSAQ